ncbi:hypothetical protein O3M35_000419 [Rhynocoris fuscipes]|uniref:Uncharacterized protein n=1 Tax=Rhynocoris fuscipes TaxID=488301 RepID=A0AAW1DPC9_9HEMI
MNTLYLILIKSPSMSPFNPLFYRNHGSIITWLLDLSIPPSAVSGSIMITHHLLKIGIQIPILCT